MLLRELVVGNSRRRQLYRIMLMTNERKERFASVRCCDH